MVANPTLVEPLLDYPALLAQALGSPAARSIADDRFAQAMVQRSPLSADHGSHLLRPSNLGGCSLALAASALGLSDLPTSGDSALVMDTGTLVGAWAAALLDAVLPEGFFGHLERPVEYRGAPGSVDLLVVRADDLAAEVVEIKTTPGSGALKPPHVAKPTQCLQAATYALSPNVQPCERFTILTLGYHVGSSRDGTPHPKMRADTYDPREWKGVVDSEIDALKMLETMSRKDVLANAAELADTIDAWRCASCRFGACPRNTNPARFNL